MATRASEAIRALVVRPQQAIRQFHEALALLPARPRVVETRESFTGVKRYLGQCTGETNSGATMVMASFRLAQPGLAPEGVAPTMSLTLEKEEGAGYRRDRFYEVIVRDVTDELRQGGTA